MDFQIAIKGHIDDDEAHLMHFIPGKLQDSLAGTKFHIDNLVVTKVESERQD